MEGVAGAEKGGVEEDLVGLSEGKGQRIGVHDLAVPLGAFGAHLGVGERK